MRDDDEIKASRILIVDDEPHVILMLENILDEAGYDSVHSTTDSNEALELFRRLNPDLLLLDLWMDGPSGLDILDGIEDLVSDHEFLPVLILTGDIRPEARLRALAEGATDFLTKPYDPLEVKLRIHSMLRIRARFRELQAQLTERNAEGERIRHAGRLAQQLQHRHGEESRKPS